MIKTMLFSLTMVLSIALTARAEGNRTDVFTVSPIVGGFTFDGALGLQTRPVYGIRSGYNFTRNLGFEALFDFVQSVGTHPNAGDVHVFRYGGDFLWHFMPDSKLVPYLAAGFSGMTTDYENKAFLAGETHFHHTTAVGDIGAGVKYFLNDDWALRGDVRQLVAMSGGTLFNYEYSVGLTYHFDAKQFVALFRPTPESEEALELEPEPVTTSAPAVQPTPGARPAPAVQPRPEAKPEAKPAPAVQPNPGAVPGPGIQPETGAVVAPGTQEKPETVPEKEAPLEPLPAAAPTPGLEKYCSTLHIEFDIGSTHIRPEYYKDLATVGNFMKEFPTTTAVIEGHTDNIGSFEANMKTSQHRAETVVNYLSDNFGIERSRLFAKGYGPTRPVADNATIEGQEKNRRIDAIIDCPFEVKTKLAFIPGPPERLCLSLQIEFDTGKTDIKPRYHNEIARVGDYMNKFPTTTALIEGHTDNVGGFNYNMKLSQKRAESVVNYLVKNFGIERSRLAAKGYGYTRRIAYNNTPEGRQKNRRIDAIIDCVIKR